MGRQSRTVLCDHPMCNHRVTVQGNCGERQCPRNTQRSSTTQTLTDHEVLNSRALPVVQADPLNDDNSGPIVQNVFSVTGDVDPELVIGRDNELRMALRLISHASLNVAGQQRIMMFAGPSSSGKTALLKRLQHELEHVPQPHPVVIVSVDDVKSGTTLEDHMKHRLAVAHGGWWSRLTYGRTEGTQLQIETPSKLGSWPLPFKAKIQSRINNRIDHLKTLPLAELIAHCSKRASKRGRTLVLAVDGGERIGPELISSLASGLELCQKNDTSAVAFVASGRNVNQDVRMMQNASHEMMVNVVNLPDLTNNDLRQMLHTGAEKNNGTWDSEALDDATSFVANNVRLAHLVGHFATESVASRDGGTIQTLDVNVAKRKAFTAMQPTYRQTLRQMQTMFPDTETLQRASAALFAVDQTTTNMAQQGATTRDVVNMTNVRPKHVAHALRTMADAGILSTDGRRYRSRTPYIAEFWSDEQQRHSAQFA